MRCYSNFDKTDENKQLIILNSHFICHNRVKNVRKINIYLLIVQLMNFFCLQMKISVSESQIN